MQRIDSGCERANPQRLSLVEDDDAPGEPVQLAATTRAVREQALEELYRGRDDHRRVPVLGSDA